MRLGFTLAAVLGAMALFLTTASSAWAGGYIVTAQCTTSGQTSPCNTGWYTSDVSVSWTWMPQDGGNPTDGCGPRSFVQDASASVSCTIAGPSGQTSTSQPLHLEKSTPSILVGLSRSGDSNGWYNHAVSATVSGTAFSGIASCTPTSYGGPDSLAATVSGTCTDNAGKSVSGTSAQFSYEATSPTVSAAPARVADANGWYNHSVTAAVSGSSFSRGVSCSATSYSGPDSLNAVVGGTCTDNAGKSASATSSPFNYEASNPVVTLAVARPPDSGAWYNHAVGATVSGSSFAGGVSCTPTTYAGPDSLSATVSGTCTDAAGRSSSRASGAFQYEASSPTVTVGLSRAADSNGWYNHALTATVSGGSFSGGVSCSPTTYSGPDSTSATVSGSCTDAAGKSASATSVAFLYEASKPSTSVDLSRPADTNGWYTHPVMATAAGTAFSSIASCTAPIIYAGPDIDSTTVRGSCTDNAGKTATADSAVFKYDASGPIVSVSLARPPDSGDWYNHPVAAKVSGSSVSGIASCTPTTYAGPDTTSATVSGSCIDSAGKTADATSGAFKFEASTPTVTVTPARAADSNGWFNHPVAGSVSGSSFSGIASCSPTTYAGPDALDATVSGSCTDHAGRNASATSGAFKYEASKPAVTVTTSRPPDSNGWFNHAITAAASGISFSGIASCTPGTYSGPDALVATVSGTCTDKAGKTATGTSAPFRYADSSPIRDLTAEAADRIVVLHWTSSGIAPLTTIRIVRTSGDAGAGTVVYRASRTSFTDRHVRDGVKYRYTLIAADLAGNVAHDGVAIRPGPHLLNPIDGAAVTSPPALRWTPVAGAGYYNVQLYRGRQKVLSAWPSRTGLQLKGSWSFGGHRRHLRAGRYRWYVWPGFGRRAAVRYGHLIGSSTFMLRR